MLFYELVDCVDEGFYGSSDDIGIGGKTVIIVSVVFHLHMDFTHVVATFINSLDEKFLDGHRAVDNRLHGFDGCIHWTVAGSGCFKLFTGDIQADAGNRL